MSKITGTVTKVKAQDKTVKLEGRGEFVRLNMTVEDDNGKTLVIQKLAKMAPDAGQNLIGKRAQITYTEKVFDCHDGTNFIVRNTDSKGFVLLDSEGAPITFNKSGASQSASKASIKPVAKGSYNSEGARHGMIVRGAVELAIARKATTLEGLKQAALDLVVLTKEVETDSLSLKTSTKASNKKSESVYPSTEAFVDEAMKNYNNPFESV